MRIINQKVIILAIVMGSLTLGSATALAVSAVTSASPIQSNGRISGCYNNTSGALKVRLTAKCGSGTTPITWVGDLVQATVNSDGTFGNNYGVNSVDHTTGSGVYLIHINTSSVGCVETATLAFTSGQISVEGSANFQPNEVQVQTYDASGNPTDQTFQFHMSCV